MATISFGCLSIKFPGFLFRRCSPEIVGYNPETNIHIVIEDGVCMTNDNAVYSKNGEITRVGRWMVDQYKINKPENFNWLEEKWIVPERFEKEDIKLLSQEYMLFW